MKRILLRLTISLAAVFSVVIFTTASAHANPASVGVGSSFKPWWTGVTTSLQDVAISIQTVGIPNKTPIQGPPYNGNHLWGVDCPGVFCRPSTNGVLVDMANGFATDNTNLLGAPGSIYRGIQFDNFAWCGVNYYGPNNLAPGEFKMAFTINPKPGATFTNNGGRWKAYWQWITDVGAGPDVVWSSSFVDGNYVEAPANNGQLTQVFFTYEEDPPLFNVIGGKYDRYGNASGPWATGTVRDNNVGDASNAQPYNLPARNQAGNHWISADNLADWTPTGWRLQSNGTTGNGNAYGFPANVVPVGSTQILDFFYEPRPSTIRQRIRVKDPADGQIKDPCGRGDYLAAACNAQVDISPNFRQLIRVHRE